MSELRRERYGVAAAKDPQTMSWGSIVAGVLLALAIQLMLGLLGLGIGLGSVGGGSDGAMALASAAGIYALIVALVGIFVGAFVAARLSGHADRLNAVLHGVVTWAAATLLVVVLLGSTASAVLGGAFGAIGSSIDSLSRAASSIGGVSGGAILPDQVTRDLRTLGSGRAESADAEAAGEGEAQGGAASQAARDPLATIEAVTQGLSDTASAEDRQAAIQAIAEAGGITPAAAEQRLASYQQSYDQAVREARQLADDAARSVAAASFSAFIALLLGLGVGALGGFVGRTKTVAAGRSYRESV